jgi:hypothetical protein
VKPEERSDHRDLWIVATLAALTSLGSFFFYFHGSEILLYGDAVAHINIARRVFDSATPGPLQLGTVWLPLPHILMIPFVVNDWMWRSGVGGSVPSMIAYVLGVIGIFQIARQSADKQAAYFAAAVYGLNPNLIYMQATAMTETIFLAEMIWAVRWLLLFVGAMQGDVDEQHYPAERSVRNLALCLAAAILTRYDGWVLAAVCGLVVLWQWRRSAKVYLAAYRRISRPSIGLVGLCSAVAILWLAHNYAITANPLDFMNGPYSAKAIEARSTQPGGSPHPGTGDMVTSAIFFIKAAKLNVSRGWPEPVFFLLACLGAIYAAWRWHRLGVLLILWLPLPFYAYSVAYGSVPIFMPVWWPHSYYNVRYGLELLPAFALCVALVPFAAERVGRGKTWLVAVCVLAIATVSWSYVVVERWTPICLREARVNSKSRIELESRLAPILAGLPPDSKILMQTGEFVGALQDAGVPLSRVVWEGDHPTWDKAMSAPGDYADYVVAFAGDNVWYATKLFPQNLEKIAEFDTPDKPRVTVYRTRK